jgi:cytochrome c6
MKKVVMVLLVVMVLFLYGTSGYTKETAKGKSGEELFQQHCSVCHPDGGNIVNPQKTLHKKDLDANKIKKPGDIVNKMRHPGPGMTQFDKKTISDKDAKKIAEYVLKTFK